MKIIMLKGLPASGKSTWAKERALEGNYLIISKDEIRKIARLTMISFNVHTAFKKGHWSVEKGTFGVQKRTA